MPLLPARRLEGGVVGAVDLDGGERAAGELQLALLRQPLGIEDAAPGLESPAADADVDPARQARLPAAVDLLLPLCGATLLRPSVACTGELSEACPLADIPIGRTSCRER